MAKRRTKKDKVIADLRRQVQSRKIEEGLELSYKSIKDAGEKSQGTVGKKIVKENDISNLFSYDSKLIRSDLFKTTVLAILIFAVEIGLYYVLR